MRTSSHRRVGAGLLSALFILSILTITPTGANPNVPSCGPLSAPGGAEASADFYDPSLCEAATGRVFPEAYPQPEYAQPDAAGHSNTGFATDYIGYFEFQQGLAYLEEQYPDYIEVHVVADSYGLCNTPENLGLIDDPAGIECPTPLERHPIYMVEITNENSPVPLEERQAMLFMLSIHGNEKGGREGGFRVMEDLLKGIGFASETVQDGAGMPTALPRPTGDGNVEIYHDFLDFQRLFLLFPNTDGWVHDEAQYVSNPCHNYFPTGFCRTNGNGRDLNRQAPTLGWQSQGGDRNVVGEPESIGYYNWMLEQEIDWTYAIDIHGMLNHQNFGAIMMPAGSMTPLEMEKSLSLAETLKERLNNDPHFDEWLTLMAAGETVDSAVLCQVTDCANGGFSVWETAEVGSSQFAEYYTVIDAIGYTDSGFNGDFFAQDTGLNAPGYDIELAYNHITLDSQYEGPGALWNDYHVKMVREITKSFMDAGALDIQIKLETSGQRTLVLEPTYVATNLDDEDPNLPAETWAAINDGDDLWDYSEESPFIARPAKYWSDMKPFVTNGDAPGTLAMTSVSGLTKSKLDTFDTLVIPGTAINQLILTGTAGENDLKRESSDSGLGAIGIPDEGKVNMIRQWVEDGGKLVLTDSALNFLDLSGLTTNGVDVVPRYMGGIKIDLDGDGLRDDHPLLKDLNDGVMQMYEPTPIGFGVTGSAPNWFITEAAAAELGAEIVGRECGVPSLNSPQCDNFGVALGTASVGEGTIHFMGALLPDPTEEFYHPYGLDHYATTYSGNLIMLNMLGFEKIYSAPPVVITEGGEILQTDNEPMADDDEDTEGGSSTGKKTPAAPIFLVLGLLAALVAIRRK